VHGAAAAAAARPAPVRVTRCAVVTVVVSAATKDEELRSYEFFTSYDYTILYDTIR